MVAFTNYYETIKEARMRLERTVVLYDGLPYYVLCIDDHKGDGIFRMYLDSLTQEGGVTSRRIGNMPQENYSEGNDRGNYMDKWLDANPNEGVIRKMMNSPLFNKFRPFTLGMVNLQGRVMYTERQPTRSTYQGLTQQMVNSVPCSILPSQSPTRDRYGVDFRSVDFGEMVLGNYPTPEECLTGMKDPRITNEGVAFHRLFALLRGPLDILFLGYKGEVVGILPEHDFSSVKIGSKFRHLKETVEELNLFNNVTIKDI